MKNRQKLLAIFVLRESIEENPYSGINSIESFKVWRIRRYVYTAVRQHILG